MDLIKSFNAQKVLNIAFSSVEKILHVVIYLFRKKSCHEAKVDILRKGIIDVSFPRTR